MFLLYFRTTIYMSVPSRAHSNSTIFLPREIRGSRSEPEAAHLFLAYGHREMPARKFYDSGKVEGPVIHNRRGRTVPGNIAGCLTGPMSAANAYTIISSALCFVRL